MRRIDLLSRKVTLEQAFEDIRKIKEEPYVKLNPNGRLPTIEDPNTGITLWESGAIIEYLVETYDKGKVLTFDSFPEKYELKQFLHFQTSGQGPYYGQFFWFKNLHPEKVESAIQRYEDQILRVTSVLDRALEGKEYLVGGKFTYADLAFISWEVTAYSMVPEMESKVRRYSNYCAWWTRIKSRPAIEKVLQAKVEAN